MTAHQLAKALLASPDLPVVLNGWGSDEGFTFEVTEISPAGTCSFSAVGDSKKTPRDKLGYTLPRECVWLNHCDHTPLSSAQLCEHHTEQKRAAKLKKENPQAYAMQYMELKTLTQEIFNAMAKAEKKGGI